MKHRAPGLYKIICHLNNIHFVGSPKLWIKISIKSWEKRKLIKALTGTKQPELLTGRCDVSTNNEKPGTRSRQY